MIDRIIEIIWLIIDFSILVAVIYYGHRAFHLEQEEWAWEGDIKLLRRLVKAVERIEKRLKRGEK